MFYDKQLDAYLENRRDLFINVNDKIWEYAELSFQEEKSADLLKNVLDEEGFAVTKGIAGMQTTLIAGFGNGSPVVAILGEYDALSGLSQEKKVGWALLTVSALWRRVARSDAVRPWGDHAQA